MATSGDHPEVKLLGFWASPYVLRARIALNIKGVQYEYIEDNYTAKSELLLKSNPVYKKVPVLIHGGKPVCESMIIVQYIDEVWAGAGGSIVPDDAYERALHRFWAVYVDDKLFPSLLGVMMSQTAEPNAEAKEQAEAGLQLLEHEFANMSNKGKAFFGGDTIGYFDIALGSFLGLIKTIEELNGFKLLDSAKTPLLSAWAENFCKDDAVKSVLPETAKLVELARVFRSKQEASE